MFNIWTIQITARPYQVHSSSPLSSTSFHFLFDFSFTLPLNKLQQLQYHYTFILILYLFTVILPYSNEGEKNKDIVYRRHIVDRMPIDSWNDVWQKLHQQLVNVDVLNVNTVPAEVYSSVATIVVWSMRLALAIGFYIWIDNMMRPIYAKLIPCDLGIPPKKIRQPIKNQGLGSLGESR